MFGFKNNTITINRDDYYKSLESRHKTGLQEGFKDGYKIGYKIAKNELPEKLERNIRLLTEILEKIECNIEVHEDEFENMLCDQQHYNGSFGEYVLNTKKIIVKVSPMAYAVRDVGSVIDDIKNVITRVKED